jgi:hypothetical protein
LKSFSDRLNTQGFIKEIFTNLIGQTKELKKFHPSCLIEVSSDLPYTASQRNGKNRYSYPSWADKYGIGREDEEIVMKGRKLPVMCKRLPAPADDDAVK